MASLPLNLYRKTESGREKAEDHPLYNLLYRMPNPETTAYEFWHMYIFNLMLTKGAYAKITRDRNGYITALWNAPTGLVSDNRNKVTGEKYIVVYADDGSYETLYPGYFMATAATAMKNGFGSLDLTQTNDAISGLNKSIKLTDSEFKAATAGMSDWRKDADGLAARTKYLNDVLDDQRTVLDGLQRKLELTKEKYGEDSTKVTDLKIAINNQTATIKKNESELTDVTQKLDNFGKETDDAAGKSGLLGKIFSGGFLANVASQALSALGNKLKEFATSAMIAATGAKT